jgi:hypothetical protein
MPWLSGPFLTAVVVFPTPLILLAMGIFYLWVYVSRSWATDGPSEAGIPAEAQIASEPLDSVPHMKTPLSSMIPSLDNIQDAAGGLR